MVDPGVPKTFQAVVIPSIVYPKTKKVAFHSIFRSDDPLSKENLNKTSAIRDEFYSSLEANNSSTIISTAERYLPYLFGLVVSVEENQKLRLNSPLSFSWTSAFASKAKSYFTCYTYRFEVVMVILSYGFAHITRAGDTLALSTETSFDEDSKKAAALLRTAAGIFDYVQTKELPRWIELPNERPMEVNSSVCQALQDYCVATAQALTIKKGNLGSTSKSALSKLAVDVWNKYASVENIFKSLAGYKEAAPSWKAFLTVSQAVAKASTYKYTGQVAYEQGKYGMSVSLLNVASNTLRAAWTPANIALLPKQKEEITAAQEDIEHVKRSYTNENNNIYFQPLVEENQLEVPEAKSLMAALPWAPPQPAYKGLV